MEKISTPQARATIVWIVAEFCFRNEYARKMAPDVLRKIAQSFVNEHDLVKLQALNLAAKLHLTLIGDGGESNNNSGVGLNLDRLKLLISYIFNLAKYDMNYDVRDRGRLLRQLLNDLNLAKQILLVPKQVPNVSQRCMVSVFSSAASSGTASSMITSNEANLVTSISDGTSSTVSAAVLISPANCLATSSDSARFRIGTLSHFLGKKASDYEELPDWPEVQPDPLVRKIKVTENSTQISAGAKADSLPVFAVGSRKNGFLKYEIELN